MLTSNGSSVKLRWASKLSPGFSFGAQHYLLPSPSLTGRAAAGWNWYKVSQLRPRNVPIGHGGAARLSWAGQHKAGTRGHQKNDKSQGGADSQPMKCKLGIETGIKKSSLCWVPAYKADNSWSWIARNHWQICWTCLGSPHTQPQRWTVLFITVCWVLQPICEDSHHITICIIM